MRTSGFGIFALSLAMLLVVALSMHTFVRHQHYQDHTGGHSEEHGEHHNNLASAIEIFFHSQDKKLFLWMLLILVSILATYEAKLINRKIYGYFVVAVKATEYQDFIIPFREAFRRGVIQPKLYS